MTTPISSPPITLDSIVRRIPDQVNSQLDGKTAMLNIETGQYYALNKTSSEIWSQLEESLQVRALCKLLVSEFEISPDVCERETLEHLEYLLEEKLIEVL